MPYLVPLTDVHRIRPVQVWPARSGIHSSEQVTLQQAHAMYTSFRHQTTSNIQFPYHLGLWKI
jgi:hypothetical protein